MEGSVSIKKELAAVDDPGDVLQLKENLLSDLKKCEENIKMKITSNTTNNIWKTCLHISSYLFSSMKTSFRQLDYSTCSKILKYLVEKRQCRTNFILEVATALYEKDTSLLSSQLSGILRALSNMEDIHREEVRLIHIIHHLNAERFTEAFEITSNYEGNKGKLKTTDLALDAASNLLLGYQTLASYFQCKSEDEDFPSEIMDNFEKLATKTNIIPLFAEAYTDVLIRLTNEGKAEDFLYQFVETESKNSGILAPLQALAIAKLHMAENSTLIFHLLEKIAELDPCHPKVLELCMKYLRNQVPKQSCLASDLESECESDEEEWDNQERRIKNIRFCLQLITTFLDTNYDSSKGWSILAETLRYMCLLGTEECVESIIQIWHKSRKVWWLVECFSLESESFNKALDPDLLMNKAIVCFILESENHPFVTRVRDSVKSTYLTSTINQLLNKKRHLDRLIQQQLEDGIEQMTITRRKWRPPKRPIKSSATLTWCKTSRVSSKYAKKYRKFIERTRPLKTSRKVNMKRESASSDLPLDNRFQRRLDKRIKYCRELNDKRLQSSSQEDCSDSLSDHETLTTTSSDSDTGTTSSSVSENVSWLNGESIFLQNNRPSLVTLPSSTYSPTLTPDLQLPVIQSSSKEAIPNEERYPFFKSDSSDLGEQEDSTHSLVNNVLSCLDVEDRSAEKEEIFETPEKVKAASRLDTSSPDIFLSPSAAENEDKLQSNPVDGSFALNEIDHLKRYETNDARNHTVRSMNSKSQIGSQCYDIVNKYLHKKCREIGKNRQEKKSQKHLDKRCLKLVNSVYATQFPKKLKRRKDRVDQLLKKVLKKRLKEKSNQPTTETFISSEPTCAKRKFYEKDSFQVSPNIEAETVVSKPKHIKDGKEKSSAREKLIAELLSMTSIKDTPTCSRSESKANKSNGESTKRKNTQTEDEQHSPPKKVCLFSTSQLSVVDLELRERENLTDSAKRKKKKSFKKEETKEGHKGNKIENYKPSKSQPVTPDEQKNANLTDDIRIKKPKGKNHSTTSTLKTSESLIEFVEAYLKELTSEMGEESSTTARRSKKLFSKRGNVLDADLSV